MTLGTPAPLTLDVTGALRVRFAVERTSAEDTAYGAAIGNPIALCTGAPVVPAVLPGTLCWRGFPDFDDVPGDYAHSTGIACLEEYGIAQGTGPGQFSPSARSTAVRWPPSSPGRS